MKYFMLFSTTSHLDLLWNHVGRKGPVAVV